MLLNSNLNLVVNTRTEPEPSMTMKNEFGEVQSKFSTGSSGFDKEEFEEREYFVRDNQS